MHTLIGQIALKNGNVRKSYIIYICLLSPYGKLWILIFSQIKLLVSCITLFMAYALGPYGKKTWSNHTSRTAHAIG